MSRTLPVAVVLAALALASLWLVRELERWRPAQSEARHEPDLYVTDFVSRAMGDDGQPSRELRATRLEHFPDTDTQELTAPRLRFGLAAPRPWEVVAERAWVSPKGDRVRLLGQVHIWQEAEGEGGRPGVEVFTENLTVYPKTEEAKTKQPARIVGPWGEARGVGLEASLRDKRLRLMSRVRTHYVVPQSY
jgi:lipopolysaccharide export system protein LptC